MKIAVYSICKNERANVAAYMASASEADCVVVLDTGSTDGTWEALQAVEAQERGATPATGPQKLIARQRVFTPWRFDTARNAALDLVPADVDLCVICDMDERFPRAGWRAKLERLWQPGASRMQVRYVFSWRPDGSPDIVFFMTRVHVRNGYAWTHPVHECLRWTGAGAEVSTDCDALELHHYQNRQTSRAQYLPLLELAVREDPENDRNSHYLGREYFYARRWAVCVGELRRHLTLARATWAPERAASMSYIAQAIEQLDQSAQAEAWYLRACAEFSDRDHWQRLGRFWMRRKNYAGAYAAAVRCLQHTERPLHYMTDSASWGALPHDLAAAAAYYLGLREACLKHYDDALAIAPEDARIRADRDLCKAQFERVA